MRWSFKHFVSLVFRDRELEDAQELNTRAHGLLRQAIEEYGLSHEVDFMLKGLRGDEGGTNSPGP